MRDDSESILITAVDLAEAAHSGCALTGTRHPWDQCPVQKKYIAAASNWLERTKAIARKREGS